MQKNQIIQVNITDLNSEGAGVGRVDGEVVFVPFALPDETVKALIIKVAKNYCVGKLLEVILPSADRATPPCPYFYRCGGCDYQHISYKKQLEYKCKTTISNICKLSHQTVGLEDAIACQTPYAYRNKAQFPVGIMADGSVGIGFFASRTHNIIDIDACMLQQASCNKLISVVKRAVKETGTTVYNEEKHSGALRHAIARVSYSTGEMMVILVTNGELKNKDKWIEILKSDLPELKSLVQNINTVRGNIILGEKCNVLWGKNQISDELCGISFNLNPLAFLQVNPAQAEKIYQKVVTLADLKGTELVIDAYCGIGIMTLLLAQKAKKVIGVEIVADAIVSAKESAKLNNIENAEFFCSPCEELLPRLVSPRPDVLVLDPPRAGCDKSLLTAAANAQIPKIIYVSCAPASLARDIEILASLGYKPSNITCIDMFCQTKHVETICVFTKQTEEKV